jgi:Leucine Rich repeat
MIFD